MSDPDFEKRNREMIGRMAEDRDLGQTTRKWFDQASRYEYSYHFSWLGRPIIQFPQDIIAIQEIIWRTRPEVIVETGIARGGSLIFYASMLSLLGVEGEVIGVDVDIRAHNRREIETHSLFDRITLIEGSSVDPKVVERIQSLVKGRRTLVVLDSNHTHDHVLRELELYSPLVSAGQYLLVLDTVVEHMAPDLYADRPWSRGNSPGSAVAEFLKANRRFEVDVEIERKLLITVAPGGYLRCSRD